MKTNCDQGPNFSLKLLKKPWNEPHPPAPPILTRTEDDFYARHIDNLDAIISELQAELLRAANFRARIRWADGQQAGAIQ